MSALLPRRAARAGSKLLRARQRLEDAVELALTALDALDGDPDLEASCDDDGVGEDREPDLDGDGRPEPSWQIDGREVHLIDGADRSWAERQDQRQTSPLIDIDEAPDPLRPPRYGYCCAR